MLCQEENMEQLKVEGISKSFDGERVLEDISIALNKGELVSARPLFLILSLGCQGRIQGMSFWTGRT